MLARARAAGVGVAVLAAGDPARWAQLRAVALAHELPFAVGVHPWWPDRTALDALPGALHGACALGETGLDFHRASTATERSSQEHLYEAQLQLAVQHELPVVLHAVRAVRQVVQAFEGRGLQGQLHGFVRGDLDRALAAGLHISFGPDLTRSRRARDAMARVPRERLLLETDAPYRPVSGDRGEPAHLRVLARIVAEAWGATVEDVLVHTGRNARRLFRIGAREWSNDSTA